MKSISHKELRTITAEQLLDLLRYATPEDEVITRSHSWEELYSIEGLRIWGCKNCKHAELRTTGKDLYLDARGAENCGSILMREVLG